MDADLRMMLDMEVRPLVIDNGSGAMKAGFAGEDSPRCIIPTVLARDVPHTEDTSSSLKEELNRSGSFQGKKGRLEKKRNSISASRQVQEKSDDGGANSVKVEWNLIGDEAMGIDRSNGSISASAMSYSFNANSIKNFGHVSKLGSNRDEAHISDLLYPMVQGKVDIDAWDKMEKIFDSIFSHPKINSTPETQNILLSEASENGKDHRERMAEIMFEKYKVAGLYFSLQPVLSLYAQGRTTGLVLDVGHHLMQAVPVYEGFALNHAIHRSHFGGADLTEYMKEMLRNVS
jgi:actin-related protein